MPAPRSGCRPGLGSASSRAMPRSPEATHPSASTCRTRPVAEWPGSSWKTTAPKASATTMSRTLTSGIENAMGGDLVGALVDRGAHQAADTTSAAEQAGPDQQRGPRLRERRPDQLQQPGRQPEHQPGRAPEQRRVGARAEPVVAPQRQRHRDGHAGHHQRRRPHRSGPDRPSRAGRRTKEEGEPERRDTDGPHRRPRRTLPLQRGPQRHREA